MYSTLCSFAQPEAPGAGVAPAARVVPAAGVAPAAGAAPTAGVATVAGVATDMSFVLLLKMMDTILFVIYMFIVV